MFKTKIILIVLIFGCITLSSIAKIDIVYPQPNITTNVHYATISDYGYTNITSNEIPEEEYTHIIIKNKMSDTDNLIDEPQKIFNSLSGIFYIVIFVFVLLLITYTLKKVLL